MVDLEIQEGGLDRKYSYKALATFCEIDWNLQKENPSGVSFFVGLREQSAACPSTTITVDLFSIIQKLKGLDSKSIAPSGIIYHQVRARGRISRRIHG